MVVRHLPLRLTPLASPCVAAFESKSVIRSPRLFFSSCPSLAQSDPPSSETMIANTASAPMRRRRPKKRYHFRTPMYYRGPLHPVQPLLASDPRSREFVPGPFSLPRLSQTYDSTVAADLMVLFYQHIPPGTVLPPRPPRLRSWEGDSPYFKNRPLRAPRGPANQLRLLRETITFRNLPKLSKITVSTLVPEAATNSAYLHAAGMIMQALTGNRASVHMARAAKGGRQVLPTQKPRKPIAVSSQMEGEQMWHFFSTLSTLILPRIKEWKGVKGSSGDRSGNIGITLKADAVESFPEIAVNYNAYPPKMITSVNVVLHTTAATDRDARVLLSALGLPFQRGGK